MGKNSMDSVLLELIAIQKEKYYLKKERLKEAEETVRISQLLINQGLREAEMLKSRIEVLEGIRKELEFEED
ncbi:hypothetical protein [Proteiniclasticum sp.]|uniref:hypothetical protein n=1 Tax=Proteiniclasticum sp. TaxID=2053595 RepID=UPI0028998921|nr:hypothetical protein [Proteiniclasticum sp.]